MVTLGLDALAPFHRFSRYNSPYVAHRRGNAIDLYPGTDRAPSPVAGTVTQVRTTRAPDRPHAEDDDHLIVIDTGSELARVLHVDPAVEPGETVDRGADLGELIRSGYFAPWVENHLHLGFREYGSDPVRARGSLSLSVEVPIEPVRWDGTGTVRDVGETYAVLDTPGHPDPGTAFAAIATDDGQFLIDGGLAHYETGGLLPVESNEGPARLLGVEIATSGGSVDWPPLTVHANDRPITGLSLFFDRDRLGAKLICPDCDFELDEAVWVSIEGGSNAETGSACD